MNKLSRTIFLVVLAACFHLTVNSAGSTQTDPFPTIVLPIYQGGYDADHGRGEKGNRGDHPSGKSMTVRIIK
jgi:hypothetical protein